MADQKVHITLDNESYKVLERTVTGERETDPILVPEEEEESNRWFSTKWAKLKASLAEFVGGILKSSFDQVYFRPELRAQDKWSIRRELELANRYVMDSKETSDRILRFLGLPPNGFAGLDLDIILPIKLLAVFCKLAINTVKLFTELLPTVATTLAFEKCQSLWKEVKEGKDENDDNVSPPVRALAAAGLVFIVGPILLAVAAVKFVGFATTSPAEAFRGAYASGQWMLGENWAGKLLGGLLALLSGATTVCVYSLAFPFAIKLLVAQVPAALPTFISAFSHIGTTLGNCVSGILGALTLSTPELVGAAVVASIVAAAAVVLPAIFGKLYEEWKITDWKGAADRASDNEINTKEAENCLELMDIRHEDHFSDCDYDYDDLLSNKDRNKTTYAKGVFGLEVRSLDRIFSGASSRFTLG